MIGKVLRGTDARRLLYYLYGPGKANEHTDPHLVAGFADPAELEPERRPSGAPDLRRLAGLLAQPLVALAGPGYDKPVWHCSVRAAPEDRVLPDAEWAQTAARIMHRTGLAHEGDDLGVRWVAVRHAADHIHIVATLARQDGARPKIWNDFYRVREACQEAERRLGLRLTAPGDRTAARRATRAETEQAARRGWGEPPRATLCREVCTAAAGASTEQEFFTHLRQARVLVRLRRSVTTPSEITGYAVGLPQHTARDGGVIWYGGGKLAPDLTLPKLRARWASPAGPGPADGTGLSAPAARAVLRSMVTGAAEHSPDEISFFARLRESGVLVRLRFSETDPGQVTGYSVTLPGHSGPDGTQAWYGGGRLAAGLTLPRIRDRWSRGRSSSAERPGTFRFTTPERGWLHAVRAQDPGKPWFLFYSTGCSHAPHQVPAEWSDKYRGRFDDGWDAYREQTFARQKQLGVIPSDAELTPRPDALPAWDSLSADEKKLYARQMEVYTGYQENADWNVGRLLDAVEEMGELDDTLVIYIWGDNGASMEGTVTGSFNELTMQNGIPLTPAQQLSLIEQYGGLDAWGSDGSAPHYASAWAWAGNCPFPWGKQVASHLGGTRNGMVVAWPRRIKDGGKRSQFTHCIDIGPTILEAAGIPEARVVDGVEQKPMEGTSFLYTFEDATAAERHTQQYFEIYGNRAMYKDGWWACSMLDRIPWDITPASIARFAPGVYDLDNDVWELYYLPDDFSQARNIAAEHPDKLAELKELFWQEAQKYQVLPLLAGFSVFFGILPPMPTITKRTFYGDVQNVLSGMIPRVYGHSYAITAELQIPAEGAQGVIVANADEMGGFSLFVQDGKLRHTYSMMGVETYRQASTEPLPSGDVTVCMQFDADEPKPGTGGTVTLWANDNKIGEGRLDKTVPVRFSGYSGMDIGRDNGLPVDREAYGDKSPFPFTGSVKKVVFDLAPTAREQDRKAVHEAHHHMAVAHGISA